MFVTMVAGTYETKSGRVCLANAGHEPPLYHSGGGDFASFPAEAPPIGIAAGIVEGEAFPEQELRLQEGTLYLFSDGLTEASSGLGDLLGAEGVRKLITRARGDPLAVRVERILSDVRRLELRDDLTLLAVSGEDARG
jgi:sigma-B regulation protein RsbU (phosphoserine phosphatase)